MATNSILSRLVAVLLIASSTCAVSTANAQDDGRDGVQQPSMDRGFLFVDGQYVPRPYKFRREGDAYLVNEINIATLGIDLSMYEEEAKARQERRARKKSRAIGREPIARVHSDIQAWLMTFDTVLLASVLPPVTYEGGDMLRVLVDANRRAAASTSVPDWKAVAFFAGGAIDQQRLTEYLSGWIASFEPSSDFLTDANSRIRELNSIEAANDQSSAATLRLATLGYPLTIMMMILVVYAFGHLLSHRPSTDELSGDSVPHELSIHLNRSLMLIGGLSAVDLIWTLLVSQAGAMHELNPIGSQMIGDPLQLIVFKVLVTTAAVGLLYFCRHVPLARQASWWGCLVLTLVAARWLVFNSMFIS